MKYPLVIVTNFNQELSIKVQKFLFSRGFEWSESKKVLQNYNPFCFVVKERIFTYRVFNLYIPETTVINLTSKSFSVLENFIKGNYKKPKWKDIEFEKA